MLCYVLKRSRGANAGDELCAEEKADRVQSVPVYSSAGPRSLECRYEGLSVHGGGLFLVRLAHARRCAVAAPDVQVQQ